MKYCLDTSSIIAAWGELYHFENHVSFWQHLDALIRSGDVVSPIQVLKELEAGRDDHGSACYDWFRMRDAMFREPNEEVDKLMPMIVNRFRGIFKTSKGRSPADPWVVALAQSTRTTIVTQEAGGTESRPSIPYITRILSLPHPINVQQVIVAERWRL